MAGTLVEMRDGTTTRDARLNRLVQFDEKSRNFPVRALIDPAATPRSYTWTCGTHLDQGTEGACVGASMTHELCAKPTIIAGLDMKFAREKVYWEAQRTDEWAGGSYPGASPVYEGTSVLAGIKVLRTLGYVKEYRWAFGLNDLVLALGYTGPAVLGIPWYEGMFDVHGCGFIHVSGQVAGGHAILCKGVNVKKKTLTLHNSWGSSWGTNGDCLISWSDMDRLLHEQGEAVIPTVRAVPV
jgi:hypothetical protein